jgi:hypothetical protein
MRGDDAGHDGGDINGLPTEYNLEEMHNFYKRKPLVVARRFLEVTHHLLVLTLTLHFNKYFIFHASVRCV